MVRLDGSDLEPRIPEVRAESPRLEFIEVLTENHHDHTNGGSRTHRRPEQTQFLGAPPRVDDRRDAGRRELPERALDPPHFILTRDRSLGHRLAENTAGELTAHAVRHSIIRSIERSSGRVRSVPSDPGGAQYEGVRNPEVTTRVGDVYRVSVGRQIQIRPRGVSAELRVLVTHAPNPLALPDQHCFGRERIDQIGHRSDAGRAEVHGSEGGRFWIRGPRMHMRIDEPRSDRVSFGVDDFRRFAHPAADLGRGTNRDELVRQDGEGLGSRTRGVDGDDVRMQHHEIGPNIRTRLAGTQSQADAPQAEMTHFLPQS